MGVAQEKRRFGRLFYIGFDVSDNYVNIISEGWLKS